MSLEMDERKSAIILGGHYASLPIARSLLRQGYSVYCHDQARDPVALRCNGVMALAPEPRDDNLLDKIREQCEHTDSKPILFVTSDAYLKFLGDHFDALKQCCYFPYPEVSMVEALLDKQKSHGAFASVGLPVPDTQAIERGSDLALCLKAPIVLKPLVQTDWTLNCEAMLVTNQRKVLFFGTIETAAKAVSELNSYGPMVAQSFIPGGDDCLYYYVGYRGQNGKMLASCGNRKISTLQEGMGSETHLVTGSPADVTSLGEHVFEALDIKGVAGVDIKRDARTGKLYVIEVNYRFGLSDGILLASGLDLPKLYAEECSGQALLPAVSGIKTTHWIWLIPDLARCFKSPKMLFKRLARLSLWALKGELSINEFPHSDPLSGLRILVKEATGYAINSFKRSW